MRVIHSFSTGCESTYDERGRAISLVAHPLPPRVTAPRQPFRSSLSGLSLLFVASLVDITGKRAG
jgi:hypothetical protein